MQKSLSYTQTIRRIDIPLSYTRTLRVWNRVCIQKPLSCRGIIDVSERLRYYLSLYLSLLQILSQSLAFAYIHT